MKASKLLLAVTTVMLIGQPAIASAQDEESKGAAEQAPMMMHQMHERMQLMHEQMEKIHATEDADERKRLMHEHMQSMRSAMLMMGKMNQPMMQSGQMDAGNEHQHQMQMCADDTPQCKQMTNMGERQGHMEQRMQMMQMMMQQMMERETVEQGDQK